MKEKNKTKENYLVVPKGITLIALIITIIILLILAGIVINLSIGENGIITKAQEAGQEYEKVQIKEELELAILDIKAEKLSKGQEITREDLLELTNIGATVTSTGIPAEGEYKDYYFEVDEDYKVTIIGKIQGEKPTIYAEVITTGIVSQGEKVEIKVTASMKEGNIQTIEAINGAMLKTETSNTEKTYEVSSNGTYYFKAIADNGRSATVIVEVNTIMEVPEIMIKDITDISFNIVVTTKYEEGLVTEYKYYIDGNVVSSGTTETEYTVTGLEEETKYNIYVEAYFKTEKLTSQVMTVTTAEGKEPLLARRARPGDYVEYDGGNGYEGLWQVLYNDDTYGLQIISSGSVGTLTLGGSTEAEAKASYNNAVNTLNDYCANYVNDKYATSGRSVGSNPLSPVDETTETLTLPFKYNGSTESGCKAANNTHITDKNAMNIAMNQDSSGINEVGTEYWLASRWTTGLYNTETAKTIAYRFAISNMGEDGVSSAKIIVALSESGTCSRNSYTLGVRPVITLKSNIRINGGDGSESSPFKLIAQ